MMRGYNWLMGLALLGVGWPGIAAGGEPDPEAVRRLMEKYEREAAEEAAKKAPVPKPRPQPAPAPKPKPQAAPTVNYDHEAWKSAERCGTAACFRAYLRKNPQGQYAEMARARLEAEAPPPAPVERPRPTMTGPEMIRITGGRFQMGSPESETGRDSDERLHSVTVRDFEIGQDEVTVGEFTRFVNATNHRTDAERNAGGAEGCFAWSAADGKGDWRTGTDWRNPGFPQRDNYPVVCVSWNDAVAYTAWLSRETGQRYRLPTEAEWEYAARAGTTTARYWGGDPDEACPYANVADQSKSPTGQTWTNKHECNDGYWYPAPVGRFRANDWRLNDMLGNVWEWTCSAYDKDYNGAEKECTNKNTTGPRSLRGGSWDNPPSWVRPAYRNGGDPSHRNFLVGFRLARSL